MLVIIIKQFIYQRATNITCDHLNQYINIQLGVEITTEI